MDQEQLRRERLYTTFKENLINGNSQNEFDEEDLIDIYDYACDLGDEYVQFEIILFAARFFPESNELTQRRAYFLFDNLSMTDGVEAMVEKHKNESALWDILSALVKNQDKEFSEKALNDIISAYSDFDDETVIQLVSAAVDLGLYDWLWANKDLIKDKCQYPSTFLYELSREAALREDYETQLAVIDELTAIDPFNEAYWHMLAQTYVMLGNQAEALQAIEYALAIDPNSIESRITKAQILFDLNKDRDGALKMVQEIIAEAPDNPIACHTAVAMNLLSGNVDLARSILMEYVGKYPENANAFDRMFVFADSPFTISVLKDYIRMSEMDELEWSSWARSYRDKGKYQHGADIMLAWLYTHGTVDDWTLLIESLFMQDRINEIVSVYDNYILDKDVNLLPLEYFLIMSALIKTDRVKDAVKLAESILKIDIDSLPRLDLRLMAVGAMERAKNCLT